MRLRIESYNAPADYYTCVDRDGYRRRVDLLTDNSDALGPEARNDRLAVIGREVEVEYFIPFIEIGQYVRLLDAPVPEERGQP